MHLAEMGLLRTGDVRLLADRYQPLFVPKLNPLIMQLVEPRLLWWIHGMCPHSQRSSFIPKITLLGSRLHRAVDSSPPLELIHTTAL